MKNKIILLILLITISSHNVYAKSDAHDITLEIHQNWYFLNENDATVTETLSTNEDLDIPTGIGIEQNIEVVNYFAYLDDPNSLPVNTSYRPKKDGNEIHVPNFRLSKNRTLIRKFTFLQISKPVNFSYINLTTFYFPFDRYNFLFYIPMMRYSQNYSADIIFPASFEIEKNLTIYYPFVEFLGGLTFSWDDLGNQGNDDLKLIQFLQGYAIDWVKTASIKRIDNSTIIVSNGKNSLSLILNDEKTKVTLKIDDGRTDELDAMMKDGTLNIYPIKVFLAGHKIPKSGLLISKSIEEYKYVAYVPEMYIPDDSKSNFFQKRYAIIDFIYDRPNLFKDIFYISSFFMLLVTIFFHPLKDKEKMKNYLLSIGGIWAAQEGVVFLQGHRPLELTLYDLTILPPLIYIVIYYFKKYQESKNIIMEY